MDKRKLVGYALALEAFFNTAIFPAYSNDKVEITPKNLASIDVLCRRDITVAAEHIEKVIKLYSPAVKRMEEAYKKWRSSENPSSDIIGYSEFNDAQVQVRELERQISTSIKIMDICSKPSD